MTADNTTLPRFLTRLEFCEALRISECSYHSLAKRGLVHPIRIGRSVRIPATEIDAVIERLNSQQPEKAAARRQRRAA